VVPDPPYSRARRPDCATKLSAASSSTNIKVVVPTHPALTLNVVKNTNIYGRPIRWAPDASLSLASPSRASFAPCTACPAFMPLQISAQPCHVVREVCCCNALSLGIGFSSVRPSWSTVRLWEYLGSKTGYKSHVFRISYVEC
jgi:hypothetical protein